MVATVAIMMMIYFIEMKVHLNVNSYNQKKLSLADYTRSLLFILNTTVIIKRVVNGTHVPYQKKN